MIRIKTSRDKSGQKVIQTNLSGRALLSCPVLSKGTGFDRHERAELGLMGLLPYHIRTLEEQAFWAYEEFKQKTSDLERHIYLRALQDNIETVFYRLLYEHIEEMMPLVYTPIVGDACRRFSRIYRRGRGLIIAYPAQERIETLLDNRPYFDVDVIVVTDGERILGLGDQGLGGMGIPIGKLSLYTLCGGIHPARTLPILLDTGTDNEELLKDPLYLGWRHERVRGTDYDQFIDAFVRAVSHKLPGALLQWEDFSQANARPILERHRHCHLTFNDDIQGTATVTLGALVAALAATETPLEELQVVIVGAGSAGVGVSDGLVAYLQTQGFGPAEAASRLWLVDRQGLLHDGMEDLNAHQRRYAQPSDALLSWKRDDEGRIDLLETVRRTRANVLVGVSGQRGRFGEDVVRAMSAAVPSPIIFPLSNPTSCSEATPADLLAWSSGRALVATGSPFGPVGSGSEKRIISQCNNAYVFPGLGLGAIACRARRITDGMLLAAAMTLSECSPARQDPSAALFPPLEQIRDVSRRIAIAVALQAVTEGVAPDMRSDEVEGAVDANMWIPEYLPLRRPRERWSW
ncbi:MAG: NAD-dependent malic enzyme [Acidobacteriota bacterium]